MLFESDTGIMYRALRILKEPSRLLVSFVIACLIFLAYWLVPWGWLSFVWSVCVLHWMGEYQVVFQKQNKLI